MKFKSLYNTSYLKLLVMLSILIGYSLNAQVGIGTSNPEGILDLETSTTGLVYPRISLTKTNLEAPVINPNGGNIVAGTAVYNTVRTQTGSNDVFPGIYAWDSTKWVPQFIMEEYKIYKQTGGDFRTTKTGSDAMASNAQNIPGLTNVVFTPTYSGTYKIKVNTNFGAGEMTNYFIAEDAISAATAEGNFLFNISGLGVDIDPTTGAAETFSRGWIYTHSIGVYNATQSPTNVISDKVAHYSSAIWTRYLTAGMPYTFNLGINIYTGANFAAGTAGQGHVGLDIPCSVEFTLVKE